jgi:hypothetical protein
MNSEDFQEHSMFPFSPEIDLDCLSKALSMSEINHLLPEQEEHDPAASNHYPLAFSAHEHDGK